MRHYKRKCLYIDANVQGSLLLRVAAYWIACVTTIEFLTLSWQIATGPEQPTYFTYFLNQDWRLCCIRLVASALLLVPIIFDMLQLSNRFAGPVYRMQRVLRNVIENGTVQQIQLRDKDYWHDFAADLNAVLSRLASEDRTPTQAANEEPIGQPVAKIVTTRKSLAIMEAKLRQLPENVSSN